VEDFKIDYFERMQQMNLKNPRLIGFGISDRDTFANACKYSSGAIIGSAFIKALQQEGPLETRISGFIRSVRG
jgi:tryptophan synthase alpha chain